MPTSLIGDRYEILNRLGAGGMGEVYRVRDVRLLRDVAIKILKNTGESEEALFFFHREARALASLRHPGIVQIFDYSGPKETPPYIVMDLLEGGNLSSTCTPLFPLPGEAILAVAESVASALAHAHEHGVVHRDIKPGNVMLEPSGRVVLTDFGLAKPFHNPMQLGGTLANRVTQLHGTPSFLAPEQITRGECGSETDIFALGSVIYWLAAGASPFGDSDMISCLRRVVSLDCIALRKARPDVDAEVYSLVAACHTLEASARIKPVTLAKRCQDWRRARGLPGPQETLASLMTGSATEESRPQSKRGERRDTVVDSRDLDGITGVLTESGKLEAPDPEETLIKGVDDPIDLEETDNEQPTASRSPFDDPLEPEETFIDQKPREPWKKR